jgi:hypothetical protein
MGRLRARGLAASVGDVLCNWRRTPADALTEMLRLALRNQALMLRANRRTRNTRTQRLASGLIFLVDTTPLGVQDIGREANHRW